MVFLASSTLSFRNARDEQFPRHVEGGTDLVPWPAFFAFLEFFLVGGCKARSSFQPTRPMVTNTSPRSSSPPWGGGWHHTYFAGTQTDAETTDSTLMQRKHIIFALSFPTHVCTPPGTPSLASCPALHAQRPAPSWRRICLATQPSWRSSRPRWTPAPPSRRSCC